jgi:hypothetical protein
MSRPSFERLAPPPRAVPPALRLQALFGGALSVTGFMVLALLSPVAWLFAGNADVLSPFVFRAGAERAEGRVQSIRKTSASEGERPVYEVGFSFRGPDGTQRLGASFVTGRHPAVGEAVGVEYLALRPDVARIEGGRLTIFGPAAVVSLIFPAIGAVLALLGVRSGRRRLRLLGEGQLASAGYLRQAPTNVTINGRPLLELTFEYKAADGSQHTVAQRTTEPGALTDERREQLLYLPAAPERATLVDALPKAVAVDERGELTAPGTAALAVLPVLLALFVNAALFAWRFLR